MGLGGDRRGGHAVLLEGNVRGIRESSDKALKIMAATTVMAVVMIAWCRLTMAVRPETRHLPPAAPDLSKKVDAEGSPKINEVTGRQEDPLGWLAGTAVGEELRDPSKVHWLSLVGALGILVAFGHSVLAMSGEETLAQVYREVESPKLANFKKAAFIVFIYSLVLTCLISFFAVMIIPDGLGSRLQGQPDRRPGDERHRAEVGEADPPRPGGRRRVPDPGRGR